MTYENERGEIFNDFGERIWPSCYDKDPELGEFLLKDRLNHPEEQCVNGGFKHRMLQTIVYNNREKKESYVERICYDCGKKASCGIRVLKSLRR